MSLVSFRLSDEEKNLVKEYTKANNINLSSFIRNLLMDAIEDDLKLDEKRILEAKSKIQTEPVYDHEEVWKRLGV